MPLWKKLQNQRHFENPPKRMLLISDSKKLKSIKDSDPGERLQHQLQISYESKDKRVTIEQLKLKEKPKRASGSH